MIMEVKGKNAVNFTKYYQAKKVSETYDSQREKNAYRKRKRKRELNFFLELLDKEEKDKILELGSSSGFLTKHLGDVTAIDTSKEMLELTQRKNPQARCILGNMFDMPFKANSFDKVAVIRTWNHLNEEDLKNVLGEVKRVLKKGGILVFDVEEKSLIRKIVAKIYQTITKITGFKIYQYSLKEIKDILYKRGYKIEKVKYLKHRIGRQIILRTRLI